MSDWFDERGNARIDIPVLLDAQGVLEALIECVQLGALVALGSTSDGGALGVTITVDGRWRREYFRDGMELGLWLAEALPAVRTATDARAASSEPRNGSRRRRGL